MYSFVFIHIFMSVIVSFSYRSGLINKVYKFEGTNGKEQMYTQYNDLKGSPSDHREECGQFFGQNFFDSFGAARFSFLAHAGYFLSVALLHDFFLTILPCTIFFGNCPPPSPEI